MSGKELIDFIKTNNLEIKSIHTIMVELLKKKIINPSNIIDAYTAYVEDKCFKLKSHYEDSCVSAMQLIDNPAFTGEHYENAKKRFLYNTSFSKNFPGVIGYNLTEEDRQYWSDFFERTYGFKPEK